MPVFCQQWLMHSALISFQASRAHSIAYFTLTFRVGEQFSPRLASISYRDAVLHALLLLWYAWSEHGCNFDRTWVFYCVCGMSPASLPRKIIVHLSFPVASCMDNKRSHLFHLPPVIRSQCSWRVCVTAIKFVRDSIQDWNKPRRARAMLWNFSDVNRFKYSALFSCLPLNLEMLASSFQR